MALLRLVKSNLNISDKTDFLHGISMTMINNYSFSLHSQLFQANRDQNSIVKNAINPPILARYVKLNPRGWYRHISMRVDYYGCVAGK